MENENISKFKSRFELLVTPANKKWLSTDNGPPDAFFQSSSIKMCDLNKSSQITEQE